MSARVVLQDEDSHGLDARITDDGDLVIEGQDLGAVVEGFWGSGLEEYEWTITIRAAHIPQFIAALSGADGDDILALLAARYSEDRRCATTSFLKEHSIPFDFWNRAGS
jgi:hypothetical protein